MENSAPRLHILPGMDVFGALDNAYIGSVVGVLTRPAGGPAQGTVGSGSGHNPTGSETAPPSGPQVHEEGATVGSAERERTGSRLLGEEMGPVPTMADGNTGPMRQSAARDYATSSPNPAPDAYCFAVRPGRINLGVLTPPIYIPTSAVASISMERIILMVRKEEIPAAWKAPPQ